MLKSEDLAKSNFSHTAITLNPSSLSFLEIFLTLFFISVVIGKTLSLYFTKLEMFKISSTAPLVMRIFDLDSLFATITDNLLLEKSKGISSILL